MNQPTGARTDTEKVCPSEHAWVTDSRQVSEDRVDSEGLAEI